ncbi:MAG: TIM barrel protein, partial [Candidatus Aminicenantes bacterium]|nr:TIM barrel protein [Candidatus Aminicenantes bacterium]
MNTPADRLLFGTAGVPHSSQGTSSLSGIKHISFLGLDCMEVEFVKGVKMGSDTAKNIAESAQKLGIKLSVHAPYYINLNSADKGKWLVSQERILNSARIAALCGAQNVVFHCGFYGPGSPEDAFQNIKMGLKEIVSILKSERTPVSLRAETMGKKSQFGSLEEILFLCQEVEGLLPCIDISHIHAREGKVNSTLEFYRILTKISKKLGKESLANLHIHISGVEYNTKGEIKHLNLRESDFKYDEWIQALKDFDVKGMVICESPTQEQDAIM